MSLVLVCLILFLFNYLFYYLVFFFRDINNILFMSLFFFFFWLNKISWNNHRVLFEFLNDKHVVIEYSLHHISRSYDIMSCKRAVLNTAIIVKRSLNCTIMKIILFSFVNSISFRELDRPPSVCLST